MSTDHSPKNTDSQPEINRRGFVKTAAAATAAAAAVTQGPLVKKAKAAEGTVRYGFIGPGSRGSRLLTRHLQHCISRHPGQGTACH